MPPEPLPWDRKDFFKQRKHERSESLGSLGGGRWRETSSHYGSRDFPRWGSADFRRPPGHVKQGGPPLLTEEPGHVYGVSRSADEVLEDENCRPSFSREEVTYGRSSRDNKGHFILRDCRGHSWEMNNGSANVSRRLSVVNNDPRLVDDAHALPYNSHPDFMHTWDQQDKMGNGSGTCQRCNREKGLDSNDWKTLKWNRSGSLPARGSGLSHSSSSRSNGCLESGDVKTDVQGKSATQVDSLSGDAACVTSAAPYEETTSRKKPRLGWGEGLAKYEKKKVEAPDLILIKDSVVVSNSVSEPSPSAGVSLADKSPKLNGCLDCVSPATPSSVACSSSPGLEDKLYGKGANMDHDVSTSSASPGLLYQDHMERLPFNLEDLNAESLATLGSSIPELLQRDVGSTDSTSSMSCAMNKLLIWKVNISKVLETTESEIDLFETELKSLRSGVDSGPRTGSSFKVGYGTNHSEGCVGNPNMPSHLWKVEIISPAERKMDMQRIGNFQSHNETRKVEDVDSPGTATSNFYEPMPLVHVVNNCACFEDVSTIQSTSSEVKCLVACSNRNHMKAGGDAGIIGVKESVGISVCPNQCSSISNSLYDVITSANKNLAKSASETFYMLLPKDCCVVDKLGPTSDIGNQNDALMKEKFASRNRLLKFRERVAAIKFRALHLLWKEDMLLLAIKKSRPKSHRKLEIGLRTSVSGYQKPRSSVHSCVAFPAGNMSLIRTSNMIAFTKKLLSTPKLTQRSTLKMPQMILDDKEKMVSRFVSNNGVVEDPLASERERAMVNPWMSDEKEIFLDKLAIYGKDFRKIAAFLDHKTTADCVEFYYKNHKSESFKNIMKKQGTSSANSKLVRSKWNQETGDASLDILSAASVMAVQVDGMTNQQKIRSGRSLLEGYCNVKTSKCNGALEGSKALVVPTDEMETVAADVLAGISCSFLPEGKSSRFTNSIEPAEGHKKQKSLKMDSNMQQTLMPDATQHMDGETCSDDSSGEVDSSDWTDGEKTTFLQAVASYGKDFAMISRCVGTKSRDQCKVFFSKARKCLGLDILHSRLQNEGSPVNHNGNGGGTDAEDACAGEVGFVASTNKLSNRMEEDLPSSIKNVCEDESDSVDASHLSVDGLNKSDIDEQGEQDEDNIVSDLSAINDSSELVLDGDRNFSCGSHKGPCLAQAVVIECGKEQIIEVGNVCTDSISNAGGMGACTFISNVAEKKLVSPVTNWEVLNGEEPVLGNGLYVADHNNIDAEANEGPEKQQNVPLEKTVAILLPKENPHSTMNSTSKNKMDSTHQLSSTLEFKESTARKSHKSVNECRQHVSGQSFAENVKPSNILQGYTLQMSINNEGNDDVSCSSSVIELPLITQKVEQRSDHSTSDCKSFSDPEKTCNAGDVKLFGKILTNHSVQKSNLFKTRVSEKGSRNGRNDCKSSSVKLSSHRNLDVNSAVLKFDRGNCLGLENIPMKNHGYWDGNRIQTGISSLPDSAVLLAKYPAAFGNYTATSPRPELSFQTVAKVSERSLGGVPSFGQREISCSDGVVDYAMYRSRDAPKSQQPITVDVKHMQDIYCEVQKRNGFEALGGGLHQQQGRNAIVGMNGVGRPGILVGGSCASVSDPVAAIRMHYANIVDQYSGQNGSIVRENESWGGKGDIGR